MAKSAKAAEVASMTAVAPELSDLMKSAEEAKATQAKLQAKLTQAKEAEKDAKAKAQEAVKAVLAPFVDRVSSARKSIEDAKVARKAAVEGRKAEDAAYKSLLEKLEGEVNEVVAEAVAIGIPEGMVRGTTRKAKSGSTSDKGSRKNIKLAEIGTVSATTVEAVRRTGDGVDTCTVVYEVAEAGDGSFEVYAKRVDDGKGNISEEKMAGGYTHQSGNLSKVTTSPGWHETADVQYALLFSANKLDEFPSVSPANAASTITANGVSVPAPAEAPEVVEEETV
jgi:hypothetical protein